MKITHPKPQPIIVLEMTLNELIALKTFAEYYTTTAATAATHAAVAAATAADRFCKMVPEAPYSWDCPTSELFFK